MGQLMKMTMSRSQTQKKRRILLKPYAQLKLWKRAKVKRRIKMLVMPLSMMNRS